MIFRDSGVLVIFLGATLVYPLLYSYTYKNETLREMPIAVVDLSNSTNSRNLQRQLDATPDLAVEYKVGNIEDAKRLLYEHKIHGVVLIPHNYSTQIARQEQATVSIYADMSSFLYYRTLMIGTNYTILELGKSIKLARLNHLGITGKGAEVVASPFTYQSNILYNNMMGFASFLLPALFILIIHQTLLFGITMIAGASREEGTLYTGLAFKGNNDLLQSILGKALCYYTLYMVVVAYILLVVPRIFNLPHLANPIDIILFMTPFVMAVIFFAMTISVFMQHRETGMVVLLFSSVVLLFLSGFSWPTSNVHWFWKIFSTLFPSTLGIQGYIKLNSMGADLSLVKSEYIGLWIQATLYFITTMLVYRLQYKKKID